MNTIRFGHEDGLSDEVICKRLKTAYKYTDQMINDLFAKVDAEQAMTAK